MVMPAEWPPAGSRYDIVLFVCRQPGSTTRFLYVMLRSGNARVPDVRKNKRGASILQKGHRGCAKV